MAETFWMEPNLQMVSSNDAGEDFSLLRYGSQQMAAAGLIPEN